MFGIASACRHELTPELRRQYRAHMCGLCLSLRDHHGQPARAVTNVDAIVLSVLVEAQRDELLGRVVAGPCPLRGMQPASVVDPGEGALGHAAAVSLLAAAVKLRDHAVDRDGAVGRVPGTSVRIARRCDAAGRRRSAATGFDAGIFDRAVDASAVVERQWGRSFDDLAAPTELAMAAAARHTAVLAGRPRNEAALGELGAAFGRLTYLLDAVEDEADDVAAGRFNALVAAHPDPVGRRAEAQRLFEEAYGRLVDAFEQLDLPRPDLARHLLVDQLGRRGRRIVGLPVVRSCATGHTHHHHHRRGRSPVVAVLAGLAAWVAASAAGFGVNPGWGQNPGGYPPGYGPGIPPDDGKKKRKQDDDVGDVDGGCCEDCDCNPCDGDGCGCDCCDSCDCCDCCDCN